MAARRRGWLSGHTVRLDNRATSAHGVVVVVVVVVVALSAPPSPTGIDQASRNCTTSLGRSKRSLGVRGLIYTTS